MRTLKSLPCTYKGFTMRSKLERRIAVKLDELKIEWDYEPKGFVMEDGTKYLPDFYLPNLKTWIEGKGILKDTDKHKIECFVKENKKKESFLIIYGDGTIENGKDFCKLQVSKRFPLTDTYYDEKDFFNFEIKDVEYLIGDIKGESKTKEKPIKLNDELRTMQAVLEDINNAGITNYKSYREDLLSINFTDNISKQLRKAIDQCYKKNCFNIPEILNHIKNQKVKDIASIYITRRYTESGKKIIREFEYSNTYKYILDCINYFKKRDKEAEIKRLNSLICKLNDEPVKDYKKIFELLDQKKELEKGV